MSPISRQTTLLCLAVPGLLLLALGQPALAHGGPQEAAPEPREESSAPTAAQPTPSQTPGGKAGYGPIPPFGAPFSTAGQLEEDDRVKEPVVRFEWMDRTLEPWFDWKKRLNEDHGLQLGFDYQALYQGLDDSLEGEDKAASGVVRTFGRWTLVGRDTKNEGTLVFSAQHSHTLGTALAPAGLGSQAGYIGLLGTKFNDAGGILGDLNWQQRLNDGRTGLIVGRFDPNDFFNYLGYVNPFTTFGNLAILLDVSRALPDWSWGIGVGHWFDDRWFALGTVNDANGTATDLDFFSGGAELIALGEVGWAPSRDERYLKKVALTAWHVDERNDAGLGSAKGIALAANWTWNDTWMAWGRLGLSEGEAPIYNESVTVGAGRIFRKYSDVLGLSFNWGQPQDGSLDAQGTTELFYRMTFSENLALTPSLQWLYQPALNPEKDNVFVLGFRARLSL